VGQAAAPGARTRTRRGDGHDAAAAKTPRRRPGSDGLPVGRRHDPGLPIPTQRRGVATHRRHHPSYDSTARTEAPSASRPETVASFVASDECRRFLDIAADALGADRDHYIGVVTADAEHEPIIQVVRDQVSDARALRARQLDKDTQASTNTELDAGLDALTAAISQLQAAPCRNTAAPPRQLPHSADAAEQWAASVASTTRELDTDFRTELRIGADRDRAPQP
jgi:hypothetical protein